MRQRRHIGFLLGCAALLLFASSVFSQPLTAIGNNGTSKWNDNYLDVRNGELVVGDSVVYLKGVNFEPTTGWAKGWDWWVDPADTVNKYLDQQFAFLSDTLLGDVNIVRTMMNDSALTFASISTRFDSFLTKAARKGAKVVVSICADSSFVDYPGSWPSADYSLVYGKRGNRPWNTSKTLINAFKNDKRIAWWEFKNEISSALFAISYADAAKDTIYQCVRRWVDSVKANDTNHLVAGFNDELYHTSHFEKSDNHDVSLTNDLLPYHDYGEFSDVSRRPKDPSATSIYFQTGGLWQSGTEWIQKERLFGIPIIVEEFGTSSGTNPPITSGLEYQRQIFDLKLRTYNKQNVKGVIAWSIRDGKGSSEDAARMGGLVKKDSVVSNVYGRKPSFYLFRTFALPDGDKRQVITPSREEDLTYRSPTQLDNTTLRDRNSVGVYNLFLNGDFRHWCAGTQYVPSGFDRSYGTAGELTCRVNREDTLAVVGLHSMRIASTSAGGGVRQALHEHLSEQVVASANGVDGIHLGWREYLKGKYITLSGWFMAAPTNRGYSTITMFDGVNSLTTIIDTLDYKGRWEYRVIRYLVDSRNENDTGTATNQLYATFGLTAANDSMYCSGIVVNEGRDPIPFVNNPRDFLITHVASPVMDLAGPSVTYYLYANPGDLQYGADPQNVFSTSVDGTTQRRKWKGIKKIVCQYIEASSADAGVGIKMGTFGHNGIGSHTNILNNVTSLTGQTAGDLVDMTGNITQPGQAGQVSGNVTLTCGTAGGKVGAGAIQLHVYLLDYN